MYCLCKLELTLALAAFTCTRALQRPHVSHLHGRDPTIPRSKISTQEDGALPRSHAKAVALPGPGGISPTARAVSNAVELGSHAGAPTAGAEAGTSFEVLVSGGLSQMRRGHDKNHSSLSTTAVEILGSGTLSEKRAVSATSTLGPDTGGSTAAPASTAVPSSQTGTTVDVSENSSQSKLNIFLSRLHETKACIFVFCSILALLLVSGCASGHQPEPQPVADQLAYLYKRHGFGSPSYLVSSSGEDSH